MGSTSWTEDDITLVEEMTAAKKSGKAIAEAVGRSTAAVYTLQWKLRQQAHPLQNDKKDSYKIPRCANHPETRSVWQVKVDGGLLWLCQACTNEELFKGLETAFFCKYCGVQVKSEEDTSAKLAPHRNSCPRHYEESAEAAEVVETENTYS